MENAEIVRIFRLVSGETIVASAYEVLEQGWMVTNPIELLLAKARTQDNKEVYTYVFGQTDFLPYSKDNTYVLKESHILLSSEAMPTLAARYKELFSPIDIPDAHVRAALGV